MRKIIFILSILTVAAASGQDVRFSQFHLMPLYLNPAMTGFFDGDVRFTGIFRDQTPTLGTASPIGNSIYRTEGGSVDGCIKVGKRKEDYIGVGGAVVRDVEGDEAFTTTDGMVNLAYSKGFGYKVKHSIAVGLQAEVLAVQFRNGGAVFPQEIIENIGKNIISFDVTAGVRYYVELQKKLNLYVGAAYAHIDRPTESFLDVSTEKRYSKLTIHGGAVTGINDKFNLVPSFMVLYQGSSLETDIGANAQLILGNNYDYKNSFSFGASARFTRPSGAAAIIPDVRLDIYHVTIGVAYDVDVTALTRATHTVGAIEVALVYVYKRKALGPHTNVSCPSW